MSGSQEKVWYQDGWIVLIIAVFATLLLYALLTPKKEQVDLQISGRVDQGLLGGEAFSLTCWHIFPGTLEKGRITVTAEGSPIAEDEIIQHYSFDQWSPNEEHQLSFDFPLQEATSGEPIRVSVLIVAYNAIETRYQTEWAGGDWSKPLVRLNPR